MSLRLARLALVATAVTGSLVTATSFAAAPVHSGCISASDPKADTSPAADPALDITAFSLTNAGKRLLATVTVDKAATRPMYAPDSRFEVNFTIGGKVVTLFAKNSVQRTQEANAFYQQGIRVDNVFVTGDVEAEFSANTLTIKVKQDVLRNAVAQPIVGRPFTAVHALARANYLYQDANVTFDRADAPATARFVGGAVC